jgi:4'-phosphopantetheinyl transferase
MFPLDVDPNERDKFQQLLSDVEKDRARRFKFDRDSGRFITAHAVLRMILSAYVAQRAEDLNFSKGSKGKPALIDAGMPIEFNLSHSGGYALVAVTAGSACGVDIEEVRPRISPLEIAGRFFADGENRWLNELPPGDTLKGFFRLWVVKEAIIKATGMGLSIPLTDFDTTRVVENGSAVMTAGMPEGLATSLWVSELALADDVTAAVAVEGTHYTVRIVRVAAG